MESNTSFKYGVCVRGQLSYSVNIQTSVCVTPHPLLKTPPPFDNKRDYKGDTYDETPDSSTKETNF